MSSLKFQLGDQVKYLVPGEFHNRVGIVSGTYLTEYNPHHQTKNSYRVSFGGPLNYTNKFLVYCNEDSIQAVRIVKLYAFHNPTTKEYLYKSTIRAPKGFTRRPGLDESKIIQ